MPDVIICASFGVHKLRGLKYTEKIKGRDFPLKCLVSFTTVLRYRAACDHCMVMQNS